MRLFFRPMLYCLLGYTLFVAGLDRIGLVGPDEPRYADVARGMLQRGDYVTPHLFGTPWFEKPPLYYWLAAQAFRFGGSEFPARLPSALAAVIFIGFWFWFVRRFYGENTARLSCLILATTVGWIGFSRAAAMDMLLATTLSASLALLMLWHWEGRPAGLYGFYALLALATLAKGPLAIALAGMVILAYVIHRKQWGIVPRMLWHPAAAVFALIGLPWYVLCYWHNGFSFVDEFFIRHNFQRLYSAEAIGHPQPFWFYLPILPAALFPWAPMILVPLRETWQQGWKRVTATPQQILLLYWIALPFVFFSLSENKLPGYLLPVLPPLTLWIAHSLDVQSGEPSSGSRFARVSLGLSALLLLAAPLIAWLLPEALATGLTRAARQLSLPGLAAYLAEGPIPVYGWMVLAVLVLLSLALLWRGHLLGGAFTGLLGVAWVVLLLTTYLAPAVNNIASMRTIAQHIASHDAAPGELAVFYLHRNQVYGLGFYLRSLPPEWRPEAAGAPIRFVAARSDIAVDELHPGARSLTLFPLQNLRLWRLASAPASELATAGARVK